MRGWGTQNGRKTLLAPLPSLLSLRLEERCEEEKGLVTEHNTCEIDRFGKQCAEETFFASCGSCLGRLGKRIPRSVEVFFFSGCPKRKPPHTFLLEHEFGNTFLNNRSCPQIDDHVQKTSVSTFLSDCVVCRNDGTQYRNFRSKPRRLFCWSGPPSSPVKFIEQTHLFSPLTPNSPSSFTAEGRLCWADEGKREKRGRHEK